MSAALLDLSSLSSSEGREDGEGDKQTSLSQESLLMLTMSSVCNESFGNKAAIEAWSVKLSETICHISSLNRIYQLVTFSVFVNRFLLMFIIFSVVLLALRISVLVGPQVGQSVVVNYPVSPGELCRCSTETPNE